MVYFLILSFENFSDNMKKVLVRVYQVSIGFF